MAIESNRIAPKHPSEAPSFSLGLIRVVWTILGPICLVGAIAYSAWGAKGWFTFRDAVPAFIVAPMILCRWVEQRSGNPLTAYGDPSTSKHFQQWLIILIVGSALAWALANIIGNYLLN